MSKAKSNPAVPGREPPSDELLRQPHDSLFSWVFSQREHAMGLLKAALPQAVSSAIDWSTLHHEPGSFVDDALRSRHTDLALSARLGDAPVVVYSLVEHQRDPEDLMPFRFGVYMMRLWEKLVRGQPGLTRLPPIVPLLIHHSDAGWKKATAFQEIIELTGVDEEARAALVPHIPRFELRLIDLSRDRVDTFVESALTALGRVAFWCMSIAGDDVRLARELGRMSEAIEEVLQAPNGMAAFGVLLRYLAVTHAGLRVEKVGKLLKQVAGPRAQEAVVTFLDEVEQRGERRGERRGQAKTLIELLVARFGPVPTEVSGRLMTADEKALSRYTLRVLTAPTLDDVFRENGEKAPPAKRPPARRRAP